MTKGQTMGDIINVSYSKAQSFKTCEYKYNLAFVEPHSAGAKKPGLMPIKKSKALARGTFGHAIMERFHKAMMKEEFPYSQDRCKALISEAVAWGISQPEGMEYGPEINRQILHYGTNVFPAKNWRVLAVEAEYRLPVGIDEATGLEKVFAFTVDLLVEINGAIVAIDHKFSADAYSDDRCNIEPQIPMYIGALRALGVNVKYGMYNFMRTRKMNNVEEQVVQKPVLLEGTTKAHNARIKRSFQEHLSTTDKIIAFNTSGRMPTRNANNNCDYCDFKRICSVELRGDDASLIKQTEFEPNDYGYEE
jgi:hypothetical protein